MQPVFWKKFSVYNTLKPLRHYIASACSSSSCCSGILSSVIQLRQRYAFRLPDGIHHPHILFKKWWSFHIILFIRPIRPIGLISPYQLFLYVFFTNWSTSVSIFTTPFASTASNTSFIVKAFISIRVACVLTFGHVRASYNSLNTFLHLLWVSIKILNYTFGYICRNRTRSLCHLVVLPSAGIVGAVKVADTDFCQ